MWKPCVARSWAAWIVMDPASLPILLSWAVSHHWKCLRDTEPVCMQNPTLGPSGDATQPAMLSHCCLLLGHPVSTVKRHFHGVPCHAVGPLRVGMGPFLPACPQCVLGEGWIKRMCVYKINGSYINSYINFIVAQDMEIWPGPLQPAAPVNLTYP